ncbi:MAG TPA: SsrA-binding protein SmpB [Myxococcota bacterium]|nr:SsrA-binding protein SmpB [Myxococcota bacterium]
MAAGKGEDSRKVIASNRKARYEYEILDTFEAGLVLLGPEVKSLRAGKANLGDAYAEIRRGEVYLLNAHIGAYEQAGRANADPLRERKLLLHQREIARLVGRVAERGFTLIPLQLYFKDGRAKVQLALARGKRRYDKREAIRERETDRDLKRTLRARGRPRA